MKSANDDPGSISTKELAEYWRMPSVRAARELARALGLRRVKGKFPWYSVWATEGLAPPRRNRWGELKLPHCTAVDVAETLGESVRSGRRRGISKPDPSFPDPIPLQKKPMLWRTAQLRAWQAGLPVPQYPVASTAARRTPKPLANRTQEAPSNTYNPFAEARSAATGNG